MNGTVNPSSGGGEPTSEGHRDDAGVLPAAVREAREQERSADRVYLLLREAGRPLTYDDLEADLGLSRRYLQQAVKELRDRDVITSVLVGDGSRREAYFPQGALPGTGEL